MRFARFPNVLIHKVRKVNSLCTALKMEEKEKEKKVAHRKGKRMIGNVTIPPSKRAVKLADEAAELHKKEEADKESVIFGTMPSMMVQTCLPRSPVKGDRYVHRGNNYRLTLVSGTGELPFGFMPRILLAQINHAALTTQSAQIDLGQNIAAVLKVMGLDDHSYYRKQLYEQWCRVMSTFFTFEKTTVNTVNGEKQYAYLMQSTHIGDIEVRSDANPAKFSSKYWIGTCTLSPRYLELLQQHPVPISLAALSMMRRNTLEMDLYCWLTYRLYSLNFAPEKQVELSYEQLRDQFNFSEKVRIARFKQMFHSALKNVISFYLDADGKITENPMRSGLIFHAGTPHIKVKD